MSIVKCKILYIVFNKGVCYNLSKGDFAMRCKNCGLDNNDSLYICQNCGSPLYDEKDFDNSDDNIAPKKAGAPAPAPTDEEEKKSKQLTIIIIALCVVLVAVVGAIIGIVAANNNNGDETTTSITTTTQKETTSQTTTQPSTTTTTTTEAPTTTTTTTTTTEASTEAKLYTVSVSSNKGGKVVGAGKFEFGEHVTVIAIPETGYVFDGWYVGDKVVSTTPEYTFTVKENANLNALFIVEEVDVVVGDSD